MQEFFKFPRKKFYIRELVRITGIAQPSVINHLKELEKEKLIIKDKTGLYPIHIANRDGEMFKLYKRNDLILNIHQNGLLDYIYDSCLPAVIILFGSASKGEDIEESDIDIFIQSQKKKLALGKYEKILNRKISLFFEEKFNKLSKELKNNLLNGLIVKGYIKVF